MSVFSNQANGVQTFTTRWRNSKSFVDLAHPTTSTQKLRNTPPLRGPKHVAELHLAKYWTGPSESQES